MYHSRFAKLTTTLGSSSCALEFCITEVFAVLSLSRSGCLCAAAAFPAQPTSPSVSAPSGKRNRCRSLPCQAGRWAPQGMVACRSEIGAGGQSDGCRAAGVRLRGSVVAGTNAPASNPSFRAPLSAAEGMDCEIRDELYFSTDSHVAPLCSLSIDNNYFQYKSRFGRCTLMLLI